MDIRELAKTILEKTKGIRQFIQEKAKEIWLLIVASPKNIAIATASFIIFVCVLLLMGTLFKPKADEVTVAEQIPFSPLVEEILPPEQPAFEQEYGVFREPDDAWGEEEIDRWFAEPDGAIFEQLERANDATVNDIFGAVP